MRPGRRGGVVQPGAIDTAFKPISPVPGRLLRLRAHGEFGLSSFSIDSVDVEIALNAILFRLKLGRLLFSSRPSGARRDKSS
jgi:hypothetical protein